MACNPLLKEAIEGINSSKSLWEKQLASAGLSREEIEAELANAGGPPPDIIAEWMSSSSKIVHSYINNKPNKEMEKFFSTTPKFPFKGITNRVGIISKDLNLQPGQYVKTRFPLATSPDSRDLDTFSIISRERLKDLPNKKQVTFNIYIQNSPQYNISKYNIAEREVLIKPNSIFKVVESLDGTIKLVDIPKGVNPPYAIPLLSIGGALSIGSQNKFLGSE